MPVKRIPLEDFFRNPVKSSYQISPDGKYFSYMAPWENRMNIFVQPTAGGDALQITQVKDRDIAGYLWANNNRILYLKDNGGDENFALHGVDLDGTNQKELTVIEGVRTELIDDLENDEAHIMIGLNKRDARVFDPYRLNVNTGEMTMLAENPGNISSWMCDHAGKLRIATTSDGVNTSVLYRDTEESEWQVLITTNFRENLSPLFFTFDNADLYCTSNIGRDKNSIVLYNIGSRKEAEVLFEHNEVDVYNLNYSRKRKVLTSITYTADKTERKFLDTTAEANYKNILAQLGGNLEAAITSANKNEDMFIVRTYSDKSLGAYYLYNVAAKKLTLIESVSPWIDEKEMCDMEPITYTSRDGLTIHGYLTLPKGVPAENLPVVVNPHGGPWARDNWGFNPEVQFLANRGYAVLQMNFRGSVGYGRNFWESSFKQWGKKMQDDISDGVAFLTEKGIADPSRIAIYGGSYGGYATLAGLTFTPDLYACGVDYVGVSNLFTFMETIPPYWVQYLEMLYEMVGHPERDKELLTAASPVMHADKIKVPVLIAQGAKDPRVNIAESDQIVEALKKNGIPHKYLVEPEEGHGFHNEENRFKFYRAMEEFLGEHMMTK
ncbi:MAG: S9 family peptidase [Flavobacteriales bacterium]|nr:S9 family peptidase [Flavobacteriales bacterium]